MKKILIVGGHSTPAFAVLDELIKRDYKNFVWIGEKHNQRGSKAESAEFITVTQKYNIKFVDFKAGKLVRKWTRETLVGGLLETFHLLKGFIVAPIIILKENPSIILSFGGFTAVPLAIWGRIFGKKVITHEQTIVAGLANKIIAKFANVVLLSWNESLKFFDKKKAKVVGNPIRQDIFSVKSDLSKLFNPELPIVYITGGNQGANEINKRIFEIIPELLKFTNIIHQTGNSTITNDFKKAKSLENEFKGSKEGKYIAKDYVLSDEIGFVFQKSSLILSRAGANTITEILALGKLAVLIPIPWTSHDEQTKNAILVEEIGLAKRLVQNNELTANDLLKSIKVGLESYRDNVDFKGNDLNNTIKKATAEINPTAAEKIVYVIEQEL